MEKELEEIEFLIKQLKEEEKSKKYLDNCSNFHYPEEARYQEERINNRLYGTPVIFNYGESVHLYYLFKFWFLLFFFIQFGINIYIIFLYTKYGKKTQERRRSDYRSSDYTLQGEEVEVGLFLHSEPGDFQLD